MLTTLIVPGLHGSGPGHWQRWLHDLLPESQWVEQRDWEQPDLEVWSAQLLKQIDAARGRIILVGHSFGCLVSVAAAAQRRDRIAGGLLVAPADPRKFGVSQLLPRTHLEFPNIVVASSNDPWVSLATARYWAGRWASRFIDIGPRGRINIDSGFGPWPEGHALYSRLVQAVTAETRARLDSTSRAGSFTLAKRSLTGNRDARFVSSGREPCARFLREPAVRPLGA